MDHPFLIGGSLELVFMDGDQFWRYVFIVTFWSVLLDLAMLSLIRMSAIEAHSGWDGLRSRYFFSHTYDVNGFVSSLDVK
jgi:hypothetical protein